MTMTTIVEKYVDAALDQLKRQGLRRFPGRLPESMIDHTIPPSDDWIGWKAVPSTVTDKDLDSLEKEMMLLYPPLYKEILKYLHFLGLTEYGVRFSRHLSDDWLNVLRKSYFQSWDKSRIVDIGLIPFGDETFMDAGPVCFDTRQRTKNGDCPIVYWDHEWVGTDKEVGLLFSSSEKMFECLYFVATTDINFFSHSPKYDDSSTLHKKQKLLGQFLKIDPHCAGGVAKEYWTSWGVTPTFCD